MSERSSVMFRGILSSKSCKRRTCPARVGLLVLVAVLFAGAAFWWPGHAKASAPTIDTTAAVESHGGFTPFSLFSDPVYTTFERTALLVVLGIALAGLAYAGMLIREVNKADKGTPKMQAIAA